MCSRISGNYSAPPPHPDFNASTCILLSVSFSCDFLLQSACLCAHFIKISSCNWRRFLVRVLGECDPVLRRRGLCAGSLGLVVTRESLAVFYHLGSLHLLFWSEIDFVKAVCSRNCFCHWSHIHRLRWNINANDITLCFSSSQRILPSGGGSPGLVMPTDLCIFPLLLLPPTLPTPPTLVLFLL